MKQSVVSNFDLTNVEYERRRPENTELHRIVRENYSKVINNLERSHIEEGACSTSLPFYIKKEFKKYLECGVLSKGFIRLHCPSCNSNKLVAYSCKCRGICPSCGARRMSNTAAHLVDKVLPIGAIRQWVLSLPFRIRYLLAYNSDLLSSLLGIYFRAVSSYYTLQAKKDGIKKSKTAAVTFIQRFGGSLNSNIHFHTLFSDGVFYENNKKTMVFLKIKAPSTKQVEEINKKVIKRFIRSLQSYGLLEKELDGGENYNEKDDGNSLLHEAFLSSLQGQIGWGAKKGKKVQRLGTLRDVSWQPKLGLRTSYIDGFSLHANVAIKGGNREGLEKLCRYVGRPALVNSRITEDGSGGIVYELRNPYTDGTTHLRFTKEEFIEKLIALIPPPRVHLVRFHGLLAPNCKNRATVIPKKRMSKKSENIKDNNEKIVVDYPKNKYWILWPDLLKRIFKIDSLICDKCGGQMSIVGEINDPFVIQKILKSLGLEYLDYSSNYS